IVPLRDGLVARDHFARELGMLVAGTATGRTKDDEVTLFKSVGNAVQDVVVARAAVDRGLAESVGTTLDLG
ncbi:MAG: ornithine cyclodeaminase, partial [Chloroflexota bacterium]|nr:ornithine cyclodeaminase [Chloroflexota bacterium]